MIDFISFLLNKVYRPRPIKDELILAALDKTVKDIKYHFPDATIEEIKNKIAGNNNELAIFLYRLGREIHLKQLEDLKPQIHWLLKELCACEIYFNNEIGEGLCIGHGEGIVIGSRNKIGKGFIIHHGCTIGHKKNREGNGNNIGNDVIMYCNSSIIGELTIGDNVIIGAHILVSRNLDNGSIITKNSESKTRLYKE